MNRKLSLKEFIVKARQKHGDKYDYSLVDFSSVTDKVSIICPIHGMFKQIVREHLKSGCQKCGYVSMKEKQKLSQEEFDKRLSNIYKDRYDCSEAVYVNNHTKVKLVCPQHGVFYKTPQKIFEGQICPTCSKNKQSTQASLGYDEFCRRGIEIHFGKYDYSNVEYINMHKKVKIVCPIHGEFLQTPVVHILHKCGCPKCAGIVSSSEVRIAKYFEEKNIDFKQQYKEDKRYPFQADFYLPKRDLFLEFNGFWTHNSRWYTGDEYDLKQIENVSFLSSHEAAAWHTRDVIKRKTAKKNNINYVVLWDNHDINKWFELDLPDGKDYKYEYSWIENKQERDNWLNTKPWYRKKKEYLDGKE